MIAVPPARPIAYQRSVAVLAARQGAVEPARRERDAAEGLVETSLSVDAREPTIRADEEPVVERVEAPAARPEARERARRSGARASAATTRGIAQVERPGDRDPAERGDGGDELEARLEPDADLAARRQRGLQEASRTAAGCRACAAPRRGRRRSRAPRGSTAATVDAARVGRSPAARLLVAEEDEEDDAEDVDRR